MKPLVSVILARSSMLVAGEWGVVRGTALPLRHSIASPSPVLAMFKT